MLQPPKPLTDPNRDATTEAQLQLLKLALFDRSESTVLIQPWSTEQYRLLQRNIETPIHLLGLISMGKHQLRGGVRVVPATKSWLPADLELLTFGELLGALATLVPCFVLVRCTTDKHSYVSFETHFAGDPMLAMGLLSLVEGRQCESLLLEIQEQNLEELLDGDFKHSVERLRMDQKNLHPLQRCGWMQLANHLMAFFERGSKPPHRG